MRPGRGRCSWIWGEIALIWAYSGNHSLVTPIHAYPRPRRQIGGCGPTWLWGFDSNFKFGLQYFSPKSSSQLSSPNPDVTYPLGYPNLKYPDVGCVAVRTLLSTGCRWWVAAGLGPGRYPPPATGGVRTNESLPGTCIILKLDPPQLGGGSSFGILPYLG